MYDIFALRHKALKSDEDSRELGHSPCASTVRDKALCKRSECGLVFLGILVVCKAKGEMRPLQARDGGGVFEPEAEGDGGDAPEAGEDEHIKHGRERQVFPGVFAADFEEAAMKGKLPTEREHCQWPACQPWGVRPAR